MTSALQPILSGLVTVTHRITRIAATSTGDSTSPAIWRTLGVLGTEGPMRLGQLAVASRVSQPTMTKLIAGLVENEWVKRIADSSDARAWQIAIAPKGDTALSEWRTRIGVAMEPFFADTTDEEREILARAVEIIAQRTRPAHLNSSTPAHEMVSA